LITFDDWYEIYPRKKAKGKAREAWKKLKPDQDLAQKMIDAIHEQLREREFKIEHRQFTPEWKYPATWINQECYDDVCEFDETDQSGNAASVFAAGTAEAFRH
jgi:hypothetical protein